LFLLSQHFRTIESVKDRQEKAALTFTTVTVFFLPLTMLASVYGMNTADIRNMPETQWLFWATAAPLCGIGLLLWLAYLGTLKQWYRAIKNLGREKAAP
jgi:Mg2+ and Co2+ transporter CorA